MIVFGQNTIIFITFKLFACRTDSLEKLPSVILQHSGHYNTEGRIQLWYKFTLVLILSCWNLRVFLSILKALLAMPKRFFNVLVFFSLTSVCTGQVCKFIRCWKILSVCSDFRSLSLPPSSFCWSSGRSVQRGQRDWLYSLTHADGRETAAPGHHQKGILMQILSPHSIVVEALNETDSLILLRDSGHV